MFKPIKNSPVHGTAVAVDGRGFLFLGPSGAGKSALAIEMIALGAMLVSDDRVILTPRAGEVIMSAPEPLTGIVEARFLGLLKAPTVAAAPLVHVVDLTVSSGARLPLLQQVDVLGHSIDAIGGRDEAGPRAGLAAALMILARHGRHE